MMHEPTLGQVRDELKADLQLDQRVRAVEVQQAVTTTSIDGMRHQVTSLAAAQQQARQEQKDARAEILAEIRNSKPPSPWPAVSALAAVLSVVLLIAARLYGG